MRTQRFGIEIEMTGITREKAAEAIAEYFGTESFYIGTYYKTYGAKDRQGRTWKATYDSSIIAQKKSGGRTVRAADEYKCEVVSPILTYEDMADLQEIIRQLRHKGAFVNSQCGIHIHVDASRYTPQTLRNLVNIIASKEDILYKALRIDPARMRWCKKTNGELLEAINRRKPQTMEALKDIWYAGSTRGRDEHYNDTRYHGLNLHSAFTKGTVEFRLFNSTTHAGEVKAYIQFCLAVSHQALTQKKASARKTVVATHFSCPIITLVVCHRINRYNDMGTEKGKGFRTLIFCTELSPETITKTMVIISKYEVEYKETEDIFNRQ